MQRRNVVVHDSRCGDGEDPILRRGSRLKRASFAPDDSHPQAFARDSPSARMRSAESGRCRHSRWWARESVAPFRVRHERDHESPTQRATPATNPAIVIPKTAGSSSIAK